jgi:hypothetical protein
MGLWHRGKWLPLPWNDEFDVALTHISEKTYELEGEELIHAIHREAIESKWINLRLHKLVRSRLSVVIALQVVIVLLILWKLR